MVKEKCLIVYDVTKIKKKEFIQCKVDYKIIVYVNKNE